MSEPRGRDDKLLWRPMTSADLASATAIADRVHVDHPEDAAVFVERLKLYPAGCWVFGQRDDIAGYLVSHPWRLGEPPALNSLLRGLPAQPSTYYLHDLTLLPVARGGGAASGIVKQILMQARASGFANASLVAVNGSAPFWQSRGFRIVDGDDDGNGDLRRKLASYGDAHFMVCELGPA